MGTKSRGTNRMATGTSKAGNGAEPIAGDVEYHAASPETGGEGIGPIPKMSPVVSNLAASLTTDKCRNCNNFMFIPNDDLGMGECHAGLPMALFVPRQNSAGQLINPGIVAGWPPVSPDNWCAQHKQPDVIGVARSLTMSPGQQAH